MPISEYDQAEVLVVHHLADFDEYAGQGYYLAAMLSLWDIREAIVDAPRSGIQLLLKYLPQIRSRVDQASKFPTTDGKHTVPAVPYFGPSLIWGIRDRAS
ncbi:MAG: hypothetical protein PHC52_00510 [Syntrophales bacterium]|nr:hypothetical protein [Syntrophales bacterium]